MRKKKEIEFNPADYDFMDNLPLAGWMWEIIRRSKDYRAFYDKLKKSRDQKDTDYPILFNEYLEQYLPFMPTPPDDKRFLMVNDTRKTKLQPLITANLCIGFGVDAKHGEPVQSPHPPIFKLERNFIPGCYIVQEAGAPPFDDVEPDNKTTYTVEDYPPLEPETCSTTPDGKNIWFQNYPLIKHPFEILYEYQGKPNIVMALIDISASESIDDLLKSLKQELLLWRKALKLSGTRSAKTAKKITNKLIKNARIWKSYLIVYDLIESGKSLAEVSGVLSEHDDFYSDAKNIENHYKGALALINGGYRKYL
jgi:hypothetical protein